MASNSTHREKALYDKFLDGLPPDGPPGAARSLSDIKEKIQSYCPGGKPSSGDMEKSIKELEVLDPYPLLESEEEQVDFLKKIYEPVERSRVHGFDYDEKSLKMLLLDETSQDSFKLIGVVGVLGVGKTALCRLIFNDGEVKQRFVPRLWIPMSEEPWQPKSKEPQSMEKVVERMLELLGVEEKTIEFISKNHKLPGLLYALYLHLKGKRFLIVLDDVRDNEDNMANMDKEQNDKQKQLYYEDLVSCLEAGHGFPKGHGGAVIVTSRNEEAIKKMVGEQYLHRLLPLTDPESCWAIYKDIDASKKDDVKDKAQVSRADVPKEVKEVKKDEARGSGADASKEEKQESRTLETQGSRTDVPKEVKEELKKRCGGFPLVARMMKEIKLKREKKSSDAAGSNQASTTSKTGSDPATITKNNSSNEASTTKEG